MLDTCTNLRCYLARLGFRGPASCVPIGFTFLPHCLGADGDSMLVARRSKTLQGSELEKT